VNVKVKNIGRADSGRFNVKLEVDDVEVQTLPVESLSENEEVTLSFSWTPSKPDTYTLKVTVDPENLVTELNEENNQISLTVTVKPKPLPDLTVEFTGLPDEFVAGTEYEIKALIKNIGEAEAGTFSVKLEANEAAVGTVQVESLAAGSSTTASFTWKPEKAGDYTLKATVDPENLIEESDETNNTAATSVTVTSPPVPWIVQWGPAIAIAVIIIIIVIAIVMVTKRRQ